MKRLAVLALLAVAAAGCGGGSSDRSDAIATEIGAASCTRTSYALVVRSTGKKLPIYDCVRGGRTICVTEENGLASDETALARLAFATSLSGKPSCVGS